MSESVNNTMKVHVKVPLSPSDQRPIEVLGNKQRDDLTAAAQRMRSSRAPRRDSSSSLFVFYLLFCTPKQYTLANIHNISTSTNPQSKKMSDTATTLGLGVALPVTGAFAIPLVMMSSLMSLNVVKSRVEGNTFEGDKTISKDGKTAAGGT